MPVLCKYDLNHFYGAIGLNHTISFIISILFLIVPEAMHQYLFHKPFLIRHANAHSPRFDNVPVKFEFSKILASHL